MSWNLSQNEIDLLEKIYEETLVVDAHSDTIWVKSLEEWGKKTDFLQADITKLKSGGIDVEFYAISGNFTSIGDHLVKNTAYTLWVFDKLYQEISTFNKSVKLAKNSEDIISAKKEDKLSIICAIEHSLCLQGEIGILRMFHRLGLRCLQPTTHRRTWMGDGVGERTGGKLTNFGVEVVEEAHHLGMLIDAAHLSENCYWDLIDLTEDPIIISHANAKAVCDHIRNFDDKQLKALSDNGGVIGVTFVPAFIDPKKPTIDRLLDHIDHIIEVTGINHVGIGSDFDGGGTLLKDAIDFPKIVFGLKSRGYSYGDIKKIMGGNIFRIIKEVIG